MFKAVALSVVAAAGLLSLEASAGLTREVTDSQGNKRTIGAYDPTPPGFYGDPWPQPAAQPTSQPTTGGYQVVGTSNGKDVLSRTNQTTGETEYYLHPGNYVQSPESYQRMRASFDAKGNTVYSPVGSSFPMPAGAPATTVPAFDAAKSAAGYQEYLQKNGIDPTSAEGQKMAADFANRSPEYQQTFMNRVNPPGATSSGISGNGMAGAGGGAQSEQMYQLGDDPKRTLDKPDTAYNSGKYVRKTQDKCKYSATIDGKFACDGTYSDIEMGQLGDAIGQVAGSAATQVVGQQQQIKAQGSGSQADALEGAATTSQTAGMAQGAKGMMNMFFGMKHMKNKGDHEKNAKDIETATGEGAIANQNPGHTGSGRDATDDAYFKAANGDKITTSVISKFKINEDGEGISRGCTPGSADYIECMNFRRQQQTTRHRVSSDRIEEIGAEASSEQQQAAKAAKGAGIMSLMKGAADAIQAAGNLMAAKEYQKAADKLRGAEGQGGIGGYAPPTFNFSPSGATGNQGGGGLGNFNTGSDQAAVAGEVLTDPKNDDLGQGFGNPSDDKLAGVGPTPSAFSPAAPQGGGGGGGLGMGGGGSTGSTPQEQEQQAAMAQDGGSLGYSAGVYRGGGGGRAGGGGKDPDISGMMAAMMGKKEEGAKNSILDYGSRGPASMNDGLLSADTDLFKQVSKRYQQKNQIGAVGLN
jgi:hypothetical protein